MLHIGMRHVKRLNDVCHSIAFKSQMSLAFPQKSRVFPLKNLTSPQHYSALYGVATIRRFPTIPGLVSKRALQEKISFAEKPCQCREPTNPCQPILYWQHALPHIATHCNAVQHTATHCNTLQRSATQCNALQRTATHCNTLRRISTATPTSHTVKVITVHFHSVGCLQPTPSSE